MPGNINNIPLSVIKTWPTPNYIDPPQRTWMPVFAGIFQAITTLFVGTRLWLRIRNQAGAIGLDDAFLIPGFIFGTLFTALAITSAVRYGGDRHIWDVEPADMSKSLLFAWLSEIAFVISTGCTKISVLLFYRRLIDGSFSKKWKWATVAAIVFTACFCLGLVLGLIFTCNPTDAYWMAFSPTYKKPYHCSDTKALNPISGSLSVVSDLYSVLLPMGMLRHFETNRRKKIALNVVFSIGLIVVIVGIVRTYYLTLLGTGYDLTWIGFDVYVWSDLEAQLALICASAPALRVFFRKYLGNPISRTFRSHQSQKSGGPGGIRSSIRNSIPLESPSFGFTQQSKMSGTVEPGDTNLLIHSMKPSQATIEERDVESRSSSLSDSAHGARGTTSYYLQSLEIQRPGPPT